MTDTRALILYDALIQHGYYYFDKQSGGEVEEINSIILPLFAWAANVDELAIHAQLADESISLEKQLAGQITPISHQTS